MVFNSKKKKNILAIKEERAAWFFLMPALALMLMFVFWPMVNAFIISLNEWDLLTDKQWVGLKNYADMISDTDWWDSLLRTLKYAIIYVPSLYIMSLLLAVIVWRIPKGSGFFRTCFFMPVILSSVVTGIIWKLMYNERNGVINQVLSAFISENIPWLSSTKWAMTAVLIANVWMQMGYYMIIFLAGLQDIPKTYLEAATIDGAGSFKTFWHIVLPNLKNTSLFVVVMGVIGSFQAYDQIAMLTEGGPARSTTLAVQTIYETAFGAYNMGYAAALAINLFMIIMAVTLLQFKLIKEEKN